MNLLRKRDMPESTLVKRERALIKATELVCEAMSVRDVTRRTLARGIGVSASEITQRLQGQRNLTLHSLVDMLDALDFDLVLEARDRRATVHQMPTRKSLPTPARANLGGWPGAQVKPVTYVHDAGRKPAAVAG